MLLDIGLPGLDGYEVARRMRASRAGCNPLVIAVTGWAQEEARRRSRDAGGYHHLVKPVELTALFSLLAQRADIATAPALAGAGARAAAR